MDCHDILDSQALAWDYDDYILKKMKEQRQENVNFLSTIVRQDLAEDFALILAAAYEFGSPEAEKIAAKFGFNQSDFLSIDKKYEDYKKDYHQCQMWRDDYE